MGSSAGASGRDTTVQSESKHDAPLNLNAESSTSNAEVSKPLAPPPRPGQQQQTQQAGNSPDYFSNPVAGGSLSLEPNPFEQSFGGAPPETPGGTKLPSVATLTSPSSLLPGTGVTPFAWGGGSLRTGPLSPAMLSGPANDYFGDTHHIRGGFPTPNESSLRTGLTPGGSGSMFPAPSPNSQALFAQLAAAPTPSTLDFHRTALSAAAAKREQAQAQQAQLAQATQQGQQLPTSQPHEMSNGAGPLKIETKPAAGSFNPHDNDHDAANGLFMLAQGRNGSQPQAQQYTVAPPQQIRVQAAPAPAPAVQPVNTSPQMNGNASAAGSSARGVSEAGSAQSDESEVRPNTRTKGKRNSTGAGTGNRRKAEDNPGKAPAGKKAKTNGGGAPSIDSMDMDHDDMNSDDDMKIDANGTRTKMTEEEKRKNFLERNRVAALKCRQRKKQWLANLQSKVELFSSENDALTAQISALREEVVNLKTLLLAHKDCPVTQQQGLHGSYMQQQLEPFQNQMNPYGMGGPMQSQAVIAGQGVNRRYS
ncbi:Aft1 HRA domain-containing protein [Podospora didyma]|uniref:Aft1 HRA domain-containing protein n=1 Tax=Podospora didyma TaxID=330526 RepID=A0AAE0N4U2_9PEZI|nr:Aft1 HRA domain-containing protein [Podospora didyma]